MVNNSLGFVFLKFFSTNSILNFHSTVNFNSAATFPRTKTLHQSHVNAARCQRCLPFHWLTADIKIPAVSPPPPHTPTPPRTVKLRWACSRSNEDGAPTQAAVWLVPHGGRVREKFGSPIQLWELRWWTELSKGSSSLEETGVRARTWASQWEKAAACDVFFSFDACLRSATGCAAASPWIWTNTLDNALKKKKKNYAWMQQKSTGFLTRRREQELKPRGTTKLPILFFSP